MKTKNKNTYLYTAKDNRALLLMVEALWHRERTYRKSPQVILDGTQNTLL
jgi:hypothetical protein